MKKGGADGANTGKQVGYKASANNDWALRDRELCFVLLVTESAQDVVDGFHVCRYARFCRNLRRLSVTWMQPESPKRKLFTAAVALVITAAIEANLLHLSVRPGTFTKPTLDHLRLFTEGSEYE